MVQMDIARGPVDDECRCVGRGGRGEGVGTVGDLDSDVAIGEQRALDDGHFQGK